MADPTLVVQAHYAERCPAISCPGCGYRCQKPKGHKAEHYDGAETWYDELNTPDRTSDDR